MRTSDVLATVRKTVKQHDMLARGDRILVGVSGGQDSVCLLDVLQALGERLDLHLEVAHLNHGLRGEAADADQAFVESMARDRGLVVHAGKADVAAHAKQKRVSCEVAGRDLRRAFFARVMRARGLTKLALAHTASDRAETVLLNILRGCGLAGLQGIRAVNRPIIRPLIGVTRQETEGYCRKQNLTYRVDSTNLDPEHTLRNKIRLQLLPLLALEYATGAEAALLRLADIAEEELKWTQPLIDDLLDRSVDAEGELMTRALADMPRGMAHRLLDAYQGRLDPAAATEREGTDRLADLAMHGHVGQEVPLAGGLIARRGYGKVRIGEANAPAPDKPETEAPKPLAARRLRRTGVTRVPELGLRVESASSAHDPGLGDEARGRAVFDYEKVADGLWVRTWREGDRFQPLGAPGTRKLQDVFVDAKIPRDERGRVPVIVAPGGRIVWVVGHRIADDVKVTEATRMFLMLTVTRE